ncbi:MAG: hypothetical protein J6Q22_09685 [Prevotella sp.]|nr:hypothetical protein [Prevotella sp.]
MEVERDGQWMMVSPEDLTNSELCARLSSIQLEPDDFTSQQEIDEGYAAIIEAARRLQSIK